MTTATKTQQAFVGMLLLHMAWRAKSMTFTLPNGVLERYGVGRRVKRRALRKLERAGMITVTQKRGCAPVITLLGIAPVGPGHAHNPGNVDHPRPR